MTGNLDRIIDYIYDNFRYGSEVSERKINLLFRKYPLSDSHKEIVIKELNMLNIKIIPKKTKEQDLLETLCSLIGESKEYRESLLIQWYEDNDIEVNQRRVLRKKLNKLGYSIINDIPKKIDKSKFNFLNELELTPLDTHLDSPKFKDRLEKMISPVHSDYNTDYLNIYHSKSTEYEEKEKSLNNLAEANINLVWEIVDRYSGYSNQLFNEEDMFQEGMKGLLKAVEKFDLSKEYQFSTYAVHWIRQKITRGIMNYSRTIRLPVHMHEEIRKMKRVIGQLEHYLTRTPLVEEISAEMDLLVPKVSEILFLFNNETSLDSNVGSRGTSFLGDFIKDEMNSPPDQKAIENSLKDEIDNVLNNYTDREHEIINMRFGLQNHQEKTLEEIGQLYGVTRERIRQIESKTLNKLRDSQAKERLRDYYEES